MEIRSTAYGQRSAPTVLDRAGIALSNQSVIRQARDRRPQRLLEIGCGYEYPLLRQLLPYARELVGVDVQISTAPPPPKIQLIRNKITTDLAFLGAQQFDMIVMISVLEHLWMPVKILADLYGLLSPGGMLLLNVPTWGGKFFLEFAAFRLGKITPAEIEDHKMYYNKKSLWPMLVQAGFKPSALKLSYRKLGLALFAEAVK